MLDSLPTDLALQGRQHSSAECATNTATVERQDPEALTRLRGRCVHSKCEAASAADDIGLSHGAENGLQILTGVACSRMRGPEHGREPAVCGIRETMCAREVSRHVERAR